MELWKKKNYQIKLGVMLRLLRCAFCGKDLDYHSEIQTERCLKEISEKENSVAYHTYKEKKKNYSKNYYSFDCPLILDSGHHFTFDSIDEYSVLCKEGEK